jgi:mRNA-degrading endonuclease RelE of RelBE toxin-antitoxin system
MPATQLWSPTFAASLEALPTKARENIQRKIDNIAAQPDKFPHKQVAGGPACKLSVGKFRVLYEFDPASGKLQVHYVGRRRDIYKEE